MRSLAWQTAGNARESERVWSRLLVPALEARGLNFRRRAAPAWAPCLQVGGPLPRAGVLVTALLGPEARRALSRHPRVEVVLPDDSGIPPGPGRVHGLPYPVPAEAFAPATGPAMFRVALRYHLEARPRVLAARLRSGAGATRLLAAARALEGRGELVLLDGLTWRPRLAPLAARLGLAGSLVFLPELDVEEMAALLQGADALVYPEEDLGDYPYLALWAGAAGVPVLAPDRPAYRMAAGGVWLVDPAADWARALWLLLHHAPLRERLLEAGMLKAHPRRLDRVVPVWERWLAERGITGAAL
ncbi:protein of unknown function [Candidatus Hydrogenisulfobacillus filiaventi]|uniref:Glycosyl transferase family 1 domain-containing protein n=1 Tax=Candidatus Hydrogenisulfobacillus filiaventi TaxID=2707344 RepID=A0A6F8ZEF0_9FIRM|nr:protein of unknown function [Candidatus Hydrogenisulfobacillus filiaventi]